VVPATLYRAIRRAVCGLASLVAPAHADDGAAALAAGGLVFVKAPGIVMQREDLTLSAAQVRQTGAVRFEATEQNYRPPADLRALFVMRETVTK
jgi:Domain of unknown function (DUF4424)